MTTTRVEFISVNPGEVVNIGKLNRRKVRIQVMKDFRRKERERQGVFIILTSLWQLRDMYSRRETLKLPEARPLQKRCDICRRGFTVRASTSWL